MEAIGGKPLYTEDHRKVPHSIQTQASTLLPEQNLVKEVFYKNISRNVCSYQGVEREGCFGGTTCLEHRLHLKDVSNKEARWGSSTNIRPKRLECICGNQTFPTDFSDRCCRILAGQRLDGENRFAASVLPRTHCRNSPQVPESGIQSGSTPVNGPPLWPVFRTPNFCCFKQLDCGTSALEGNQTSGLPRRLPAGKSGSRHVSNSGCGNAEGSRKSRMACELPEVCSTAMPGVGIPRYPVEYTEQDNGLTHQKTAENKTDCFRHSQEKTDISSRNAKSARPIKLCKSNDAKRPLALSANADVPQKLQSRASKSKARAARNSAPGLKLVGASHRPQRSASIQERSNTFSCDRRGGRGLGGLPQREVLVRKVVSETEALALKSKRDVRSIRHSQTATIAPSTRTHTSSVGQPDLGSTHPKGGRYSIDSPTRINDEGTGDDRTTQHHSLGGVPPGEVQRHCRPPVKKPTSAGMALVAPGLGGHIPKVGRPRHRLVRVSKNRGCVPVRDLGLRRWVCSLLRRLQSPLAVQAGVGVPATEPNAPSTTTPQHCSGDIHSGSASMDPVFLANGSPVEGASESNTDRRSTEQLDRSYYGTESTPDREIGASSLDGWGWSRQVAHWSVQEKGLLTKSWRESTLATYKAPIKRWVTWCKTHKINHRSPQGDDVARFLAKLYLEDNLAYRTILLHKSAISTYCAANTENLSKNFFVQQVLKAISLARPQDTKSPIWDTNLLFNWLKDTPATDTLFDISRRTAIILLLASGRRVHDLTLLELPEDSQVESEIYLWPRFGSKTDKPTNRQSGWLLKQHPDNSICPVRHVKKLMELTGSRRSNVTGLTSLFISVTGEVKQATRTMIGGWVRTVFKEAGIDAPPGSIRSAVASKSWIENRSVEDIMIRSNWKSAQTFYKFYCNSVQRSSRASSQDLLINNFSSV